MRTKFLLCVLSLTLGISAQGQEMPLRNPFLLDSENNQGHWNDAATDSTRWSLRLGHFIADDLSHLELLPNDGLGIPFYSRRFENGDEISWFFSGYSLKRILDRGGQKSVVDEIEIVPVPKGYQKVSDRERLEQGYRIESFLNAGDEHGLSEYLLGSANRLAYAVEDQVRQGILYSMVDARGGFIGTTARGIVRVPLRQPDEPTSKFAEPVRMRFPDHFFDNERVKTGTIFPQDVVFGLGMTFNGYVVVSTLGGLVVTLDRETLEVRSKLQLPHPDEEITNSFATSEEAGGGAVYVASNRSMYRLVVKANGEISDELQDGAWAAPYDRGVRLKRGKIADGTGATPTLMGFGPNEDKLVVITDGAQQMRLVAFWRDEIPKNEGGKPLPRLASEIPVSFGYASEIIQSEQSVAVFGPYAFVINNIMPEDPRPFPKGGSYLRGLLVGATRQPPSGGAMYKWDSAQKKWTLLWTRPEIGPVATVPMISTSSRVVVVNAFLATRPKKTFHLGFDLDSGKNVLSIESSLNPAFNGAFSGIKCDDQGSIWYSTMLGLIRLDPARMRPGVAPLP